MSVSGRRVYGGGGRTALTLSGPHSVAKISVKVRANISANLIRLKVQGFCSTEIEAELLGPKRERSSPPRERETG